MIHKLCVRFSDASDLLCTCDTEWFDSHKEKDGFQKNLFMAVV